MTLIDKEEAKAALQAWLDRHNYPVNPTLFHALDDLPARGVGVDVEEVARAIYDAMRFERKDKTPEWVKGGNSDAQVEARSTAARILAALEPVAAPDPAAIREAANLILQDFDAILTIAGKVTEAANSGRSSTHGVRLGLNALIPKGANHE